ncbi:hypothetical protein [Herbaspirillum aquaticum]|uniref:hypothetical protein n=1 Tax=Herbaspirillum aquaticum TaxID=568783 RepID=UPI0024DEADE7|nr:hypothetical protein [Herbaspirillum aquaticum]
MRAIPILFIFWLFGSFLVGLAAKSSGKSFLVWFFLSMLVDPILGFLFLQVSKGK